MLQELVINPLVYLYNEICSNQNKPDLAKKPKINGPWGIALFKCKTISCSNGDSKIVKNNLLVSFEEALSQFQPNLAKRILG